MPLACGLSLPDPYEQVWRVLDIVKQTLSDNTFTSIKAALF